MRRNYPTKEKIEAIPREEREHYLQEIKAAYLKAERKEGKAEKELRDWVQYNWEAVKFSQWDFSKENSVKEDIRLFMFNFCRENHAFEPMALSVNKLAELKEKLENLEAAKKFFHREKEPSEPSIEVTVLPMETDPPGLM